MNKPVVINADDIQMAWAQAIGALSNNNWELWDLIVRIDNPIDYSDSIHDDFNNFAMRNNLIPPDKVAYTIFPYKLAKGDRSFDQITKRYNRFYGITRSMPHAGWGTYFKRMIHYPRVKNSHLEYVNQLGNILNAIKNSNRIMRAAYTMIIPQPGGENTRPLGAPCLNYIAIRQEPFNNKRQINLMAVYRNHDFCERAYGNYQGLGKLLKYISDETDSICGSLTCISSHAYANKAKNTLMTMANNILEEI